MENLKKIKSLLIGLTLLVLTGCQEQTVDSMYCNVSNISCEAEIENAKHISIEKDLVTYSDERVKFSWSACGYYYNLGERDLVVLDKAPSKEDDTTQRVGINIFKVDNYTDSEDLESLAMQASGAWRDSNNILGTCHEADEKQWNYVVLDQYTKEIVMDSLLNPYNVKVVQCVKTRTEYNDFIIYQGYAITDGTKVVTFTLSKQIGNREELNNYINPSCEEDNLLFQMCKDVITTIEIR